MNVRFPKDKILGIGTPFIDHILKVDQKYLESLPGIKGGMEFVDIDTFEGIIKHGGDPYVLCAGGSCSNAIRGLANLGYACALTGSVGVDLPGQLYINEMKLHDIDTSFLWPRQALTRQAAILVGPTGERTLRPLYNSSGENPEFLRSEAFNGMKLVHIEGYTLLYPGYAEKAMKLAKEAKALISLDLASIEVVNQNRDRLIDLLEEYVDIVFGNEQEVAGLTKAPPEKACLELATHCPTAVLLVGKKGAYAAQGQNVVYSPASPPVEKPIDTTGAGDLFASGFLHGILQGYPLQKATYFGTVLGSAVVQVLGAEIPADQWPELIKKLELE